MNSLFGDLGIFSGMMPVMDEKEKQPKKKTEKKPAAMSFTAALSFYIKRGICFGKT